MKRASSSIGICLGASTISAVRLETNAAVPGTKPRLTRVFLQAHEGNPRAALRKALAAVDPASAERIAATGRKFRSFVDLTSIAEPEAVEAAYPFVKPEGVDCPAIVSAGGETFMVYVLDRHGRIGNVITGNKCASGTGEFFLQQLRRMNVSLEEAARFAAVERPHPVSGRCSVFCKSDCTHAINKGIPKAEVTAGLCRMMANKILELIKKVERRAILVTGGTAQNRMMIAYLRQEIPDLVVPEEAPYFEALGTALWALENETRPFPGMDKLFVEGAASFDRLPPLSEFRSQVEFKTIARGAVRPGDVCLFGLDVGSTTTKAVLVRRADRALLASDYRRTNGDPVGASRQCYRAILEQVRRAVDPREIVIVGLGVTGSGRQIAGLHALTDGVINEIIAHATAAVYFDPEVDTIFEIGGQDAKYTYITNGVPSDYAMNEACSAGTGSFLEESAKETLGVPMEEIAGIALRGGRPPNFNDQCAAFIASDIKNAIHEGLPREDIVAGLVYSICMNYTNRVKGNRPVGEKVFMQGGVCYNEAVPLAMAGLVGKPIVVPPEPGLMGAFGVALEVDRRIRSGEIAEGRFDLEALAGREVAYHGGFTCRGGRERCDRRCAIRVIGVEGRKFPFGGACNRYENLRRRVNVDVEALDLVNLRERLLFETHGVPPLSPGRSRGKPRVAVNRSFLVHTFYPLYSRFFAELGFDIVAAEAPTQEGMDRRGAPFCYPAELAHGFFHGLLETEDPAEYIFLPHFKAVPNSDPQASLQSQVCPLVQGETYYLQAAFREELTRLERRGVRLLRPLLDLSRGIESAAKPLLDAARTMGFEARRARRAFALALEVQKAFFRDLRAAGERTLADLASAPDRFAVVLFGRPYSAYAPEGNKGIPHKFASRGIAVLPLDALDLGSERAKRHMYWGMGKLILQAARLTERHPQLFGTYITNFSCGPDSFVITYFRDILGRKPSLTLELDSHTADAGLETRIEAFLDIVRAYRLLVARKRIPPRKTEFRPARILLEETGARVVTSKGETLPMTDPRVTVLIPSMGRLGTEAFAAVLKGYGLHARAARENDEAVLKIGRANTSCKECLPLILTTGTLLGYIRNGKRPEEVLVYFMPTGSGPCRFGQYSIFMEDLVRRLEIPDVAVLALSSDNSYVGMDKDFERHAWWAVIVSDTLEDIRAMLLAAASDPQAAMVVFEAEWENIRAAMERADFRILCQALRTAARRFREIPLRADPARVPTISLTGEIFVRRDALSRQYLTERLAEKGFAALCAPVAEWVHYCNYLVDHGFNQDPMGALQKLKLKLRNFFQGRYEKEIRAILGASGLLRGEMPDVASVIEHARPHLSPELTGEAVLTVGGALREIVRHSCGVIAIGPFGCMPNRISESILTEAMTARDRLAIDGSLAPVLEGMEELPFLAIETDGSAFPQLIHAKLEAFLLRAERLHRRMQAARSH